MIKIRNNELIDQVIKDNDIDLSTFAGEEELTILSIDPFDDTENLEGKFKAPISHIIIRQLIDAPTSDIDFCITREEFEIGTILFLLNEATAEELSDLIFVASEVARLEGNKLDNREIRFILKEGGLKIE